MIYLEDKRFYKFFSFVVFGTLLACSEPVELSIWINIIRRLALY